MTAANQKTYLKESTNFKIGTLALINLTFFRKPMYTRVHTHAYKHSNTLT